MSAAEILSGHPPPQWMLVPVVLLGLCFGSFAGLAAWRIPEGASLVRPGSSCPLCARRIPPWRNVPLASWLIARGRSACCSRPIALRYPLCELAAGALAGLCWIAFGASVAAAGAFFLCLVLIILTAIDIERLELPDELTRPLLWAGLAFSLAPKGAPGPLPFADPPQAIAGAVAGYGILAGINLGWRLWRKTDGLGAGDPRLLAALGAWFGPAGVALVLAPAVVASGLVSAARVMSAAKSRRALAAEMPFGPFLAAGALLALFARNEAQALWDGYIEQLTWIFL